MKSFAKTKPIAPQHGNVNTHAKTIFLAIDHFTFLGFLHAPTPIIAAVEQWLVETGMPVIEAIKSVQTVVKLAATPWCFSK